VQDKDIVTTER